jgi:regulatory protein
MKNDRPPLPEEDDVLQKLRHFCSFQERCTADVEEKLHGLGTARSKFPAIIEQLKKENFLNDARFAGSFASGKFRINHWGRRKIRYELAGRGIPDEVITCGLEEIDEEEYMLVLCDLVRKKSSEMKGEKKLTIRNKIFTFASGKGFESDLISKAINELNI